MSIFTNAVWREQVTLQTHTGAPVDLTGAELEMQLRTLPEAPSAAVVLSTQNGRISIPAPATDGIINFYLSANDTSNLTPGTYYFDVVRLDNERTRLFGGRIDVRKGVTR